MYLNFGLSQDPFELRLLPCLCIEFCWFKADVATKCLIVQHSDGTSEMPTDVLILLHFMSILWMQQVDKTLSKH